MARTSNVLISKAVMSVFTSPNSTCQTNGSMLPKQALEQIVKGEFTLATLARPIEEQMTRELVPLLST